MMKMKLVVLFMVLGFVQSASAIVCYMSHPLDMYVHLSDPNCTEIEINAPGTYTLPFTVEINSSTNVTKIYGQSTFTPNDVRLKVHQTPAIIVRQDFELENLTVEGWGGPIIGTGENEQPDENPEGGCLYVSGTNQVDVLVKKVSLQHCYANNRGGAIYLGTSDRVTLDESQVILSKSQIGGGVFVGSGGRLEMTKAFFYGNEASQYGGAISVDSGSSTWPTLATSVDNSDAYYEVTFQQNKEPA